MNREHENVLARFRASIDNLDAALIYILAERFRVTREVGAYKAAHHLPAASAERKRAQVRRLRELAKSAQLDPDLAERVFLLITSEVVRHHREMVTPATLK